MPSAARQKAPVISRLEIEEYVKVSSDLSRAKKRQEKLRPKYLALLEAGAICDPDSPWEVFMEPHDRPAVDWKAECVSLLMESRPDDWPVKIGEIESKRKDEIHLRSRPNPVYLAKGGNKVKP
jgi:hypothetical protein